MNPQISFRILAFFFLMLAFACSAPKDASVEIVTIGDAKVSKIHIDKITDKAVVKFSDWVDDVRLIHLESNDKCLFQYAMRVYLGKEYILISTIDKGILKFDQNGKFLSNLVPHGRGPGEVMDANRNIFVDEKNDMLYLTDMMMRHQIHSYNIKTGRYKEIPIMHKGPEVGVRDIIVLNDSLMYMTTMQVRKGKSDCPLFCQTTSGKLLWEIKKTNPLGLTDATIQLVNDKIYLYYVFGQDTTWVLDNQQLKPVSIITSVMPSAYFEEKVGNGYIGLAPITDRISLGRSAMIESMAYDAESRRNQSDYSDRVSFVFDNKTNRTETIGVLLNDFLGINDKFYPQFHYNGMAIANYEAFDLLQLADSVSKIPGISKELMARLKNIKETVTENDNPVLLVGKIKGY